MSDGCDFRQWLAGQGLKLTAVRLAVLEILGTSPRALRAQEKQFRKVLGRTVARGCPGKDWNPALPKYSRPLPLTFSE